MSEHSSRKQEEKQKIKKQEYKQNQDNQENIKNNAPVRQKHKAVRNVNNYICCEQNNKHMRRN